MDDCLTAVIESIKEEFGDEISPSSRFYVEVGIGERAETLGFKNTGKKYRDVRAIIPLKRPVSGMKVRIDGRAFVNYAQHVSGVVLPGYIAAEAGLPVEPFLPNDSMILNFN
ncbi:MAG: hypothetical protein AMJ54_01215 [Deltaproteobacteria bacterium SG8_13]|nr:MAG: hypothetical protein AMJ54_01215 [Deltaproteobacteria bacterium SG8_13]